MHFTEMIIICVPKQLNIVNIFYISDPLICFCKFNQSQIICYTALCCDHSWLLHVPDVPLGIQNYQFFCFILKNIFDNIEATKRNCLSFIQLPQCFVSLHNDTYCRKIIISLSTFYIAALYIL